MDEPTPTPSEAAILLNMQVEERVLAALVDVLVKGDPLKRTISSASPEGVLRGAISALIVDVMRSPEFVSTLWQEIRKDTSAKTYDAGVNAGMAAARAQTMSVSSSGGGGVGALNPYSSGGYVTSGSSSLRGPVSGEWDYRAWDDRNLWKTGKS
jgi:hypothetical protein